MRRQQLFFTFVIDKINKQNSGSPDVNRVSEMTVATALYAEWLFSYRLFRVSYARQDTVKNRDVKFVDVQDQFKNYQV